MVQARRAFATIICALVFGSAAPAAAEHRKPHDLKQHRTIRTAAAAAATASWESRLQALLERESRNRTLSFSLVDIDNGKRVLGVTDDRALMPASTLKLVTAAAALEKLGGEQRFRTELRATRRVGDSIDTLYVRGGGDPTFAIEQAWLLTRRLRQLGIRTIRQMVLDDSLFVESRPSIGQRAYETGTSALSFNYNSVAFEVCPSTPGKLAFVRLDPIEAGVVTVGTIGTVRGHASYGIDYAGLTPAGKPQFSLSGNVSVTRNCEVFYRSHPDPLRYFGETFTSLLEQAGIHIHEPFSRGQTPERAELVAVQVSRALHNIVEEMNHFSNNFIAEQLVFALGAAARSVPVDDYTRHAWLSRDRGLEVLREYVRSLGFKETEFELHDGSGLSHDDRASARILTSVLARVAHNEEIQPEFVESLSISNRSGTLKKRDFGSNKVFLRAKTGTLDGVSSLAGYLSAKDGRHLAFAIIQNKLSSKDEGIALEDKITRLITLGSD